MTTVVYERDIEVEVVANVRHIGGHVAGARLTNGHDILRSASLHRLTERGMERLRSVGVRTVVDLRSTVEREREPTPLLSAGLHAVHAPVVERDNSPPAFKDFPGYAVIYRMLLERGRNAYRVLCETVAEGDGGVLYHCAAGKDRTGIATALLLEVAGVDEEAILDDYARSGDLLAPMFAAWLPRMEKRGIGPDLARRLMASPREDMQATLLHIRERWGSAEGYLAEAGMSAASLSALKARLAD